METIEIIWRGFSMLVLGGLLWALTRATWDKEQVRELPDSERPIDFIGRDL